MNTQIWNTQPPSANEFDAYYSKYISLVPNQNIIQLFEQTQADMQSLLNNIADKKANFRYQEGKWTIKEVIGHIMEIEHVFAYRALTISRGDKTNLPGMNQNQWMENNNYTPRSISNLLTEFNAVRNSTIQLFGNMNEEMINQFGTVSGSKISVKALAYLIIGHQLHHIHIIKEKYLNI